MSRGLAASAWEPGTQYGGKRVLDVVLSGVACVAFTPLVLGIAVLIWFEDRHTPWFPQTRIGRHRRRFTVLKLRSMRDQQVTRIGRWLRRTGLDELPQFLNVWCGEMSIVGPRPLAQIDIDRLGWQDGEHDWRFAARPGITGLAQLFGGVTARGSRRLDRRYLRQQCVALDIRLIALSFVVNMVGKQRLRRWVRRRSRMQAQRSRPGLGAPAGIR